MKNKIAKVITISIWAIFLTGCASTKKVPFDPDVVSPACIMAINFNQKIGWEQNKKSQKQTKKAKKLPPAKKTDEDSQDELLTASLIPFAENTVYETLENLGIGFFDKEVLFQTESYSTARDETFLNAQFMQKPEGYYLLSPNNKTESKLSNEISADYFIYVTFTINKLLKAGTEKSGKATASVTSTIEISDASGTVLQTATGYAAHKKTVLIKKGTINSEDLLALYPEIIKTSFDSATQNLR